MQMHLFVFFYIAFFAVSACIPPPPPAACICTRVAFCGAHSVPPPSFPADPAPSVQVIWGHKDGTTLRTECRTPITVKYVELQSPSSHVVVSRVKVRRTPPENVRQPESKTSILQLNLGIWKIGLRPGGVTAVA